MKGIGVGLFLADARNCSRNSEWYEERVLSVSEEAVKPQPQLASGEGNRGTVQKVSPHILVKNLTFIC